MRPWVLEIDVTTDNFAEKGFAVNGLFASDCAAFFSYFTTYCPSKFAELLEGKRTPGSTSASRTRMLTAIEKRSHDLLRQVESRSWQ